MPPALLSGPAPAGDADALWALGETAESEFDYDAAHGLYREAARRATGGRSAELVTRYAAFLVERYGQFAEVAAWLDEAAFDPLAAGGGERAPELACLVARAAAESGHPRLADLDEALACRFGAPESLARRANALIAADATDQALELLQEFEKRLKPLSAPRRILDELRAGAEAACKAALLPIHEALRSREVGTARAELEERRTKWRRHPLFKAAEAEVEDAERSARAETLRREIEAALDTQDLNAARVAAVELVAAQPESEADRNTLAWIEAQLKAGDLSARMATIAGIKTVPEAMVELQSLHGAHGDEVQVTGPWAAAWLLVCEAARLRPDEQDTAAELADVLALAEQTEFTGVVAALGRVAQRWRDLGLVRAASGRVAEGRRAAIQQAEAAVARQVEGLLAADDIAGAEAALRGHGESSEGSAGLRALDKRVQARAAEVARRAALLREIDDRLSGGRLFGARRLLTRLEADGTTGADLTELRDRLAGRWQEEMVGAAVPPVGLGVSEEPIAVAVVGGRLLIVQDRLWLSINLKTNGLQPFQLPPNCPIAARPTARIADIDGRAVLVGFSKGRLVRVEQRAGEPPEVVDGVGLDKLLRGDDRIAGAAIEPGAATWQLLHRHSGRPDALATITHIEADGMAVKQLDRHRPALASLRGIRNRPGAFLATTTAEARAGRGWALGVFDAGQHTQAGLRLRQQELDEPVARLTHAMAWPAADRLYASYSVFDPFDPTQVHATSSLLVLRGDRLAFASADLRRRFAPTEKLIIDLPWTLDIQSGRLWFAALPRSDAEGRDAMLLGVDAERLRADRPVPLDGVARVLAIEPWAGGAVALCRLHEGQLAVVRAHVDTTGDLALTIDRLPV